MVFQKHMAQKEAALQAVRQIRLNPTYTDIVAKIDSHFHYSLFGQRHLSYLKGYHKGTYINFLTSSKWNTYLTDIDKQVRERFERLIEDMKQEQSITEQLKEEMP